MDYWTPDKVGALQRVQFHVHRLSELGSTAPSTEIRLVADMLEDFLQGLPFTYEFENVRLSLLTASSMLTSCLSINIKSSTPTENECSSPLSSSCRESAGDAVERRFEDGDRSKNELDNFMSARREAIENTIIQDIDSVQSIADLKGLSEAVAALTEALIDPILYPDWFSSHSDLKPWKTVLLYGPPGTGKTALCLGIVKEINCRMYQISSSDLISSWSGQSEKLIRELFSHALAYDKTAIIFIDEVDSLCRVRCSSEDDSSRRVKTELLIQIQRLHTSPNVVLVCTTNCPWDLDPAFLRRFEKKIYVGLPDLDARVEILKKKLSRTKFCHTVSMLWLGEQCDGFTGDDLRRLSSELAYAQFHLSKKHGVLSDNINSYPLTEKHIQQVLSNFSPSVNEQQLAKFQEYMAK